MKKFAQSCSSRECKKKYRDAYDKKISADPLTPHEYDVNNNKTKCLYCGKEIKL